MTSAGIREHDMNISSRTPEGLPHRCPICDKPCLLEPSSPHGDSCCPNCGHLLWWLRDHLRRGTGIAAEQITFDSLFSDELGKDSLDLVELIMEIETDFGVTLPVDELENFKTVADVIRYIERFFGKGDAA